jgi:DDE superfamily endonuclease
MGSASRCSRWLQRLGVDHQRLQQFITSSTWDDSEVRQRLARWAQQTIRPDAFVTRS